MNLTKNDITDLSIRITDKLVSMGYVPDCTDTDDMFEFEVQDMIEETINETLNTKDNESYKRTIRAS